MQAIFHYTLQVIAAYIVWLLFRFDWRWVNVIFLLTMQIDLDHLLAKPIFDPHRCSIGLHPLHSFYVIPMYVGMLFVRKYH